MITMTFKKTVAFLQFNKYSCIFCVLLYSYSYRLTLHLHHLSINIAITSLMGILLATENVK